jgi:hypothetical protein
MCANSHLKRTQTKNHLLDQQNLFYVSTGCLISYSTSQISCCMVNKSTIMTVVQNADLMMAISSFLITPSSTSSHCPSVLSSPMLPLVLSFRSLYMRMIFELNALNREPSSQMISRVEDFAHSVEMVKWAKSMGCCFGDNDTKLCCIAARIGALDVIERARAQNPPCPWDEWTCAKAAMNGHLHVLQWVRAHDPPCPWDEKTCAWAAEYGHLHVLQWARAQDSDCPWNEETCENAAGNGHLHVLQWARAQNPPCPWDEWTCAIAAMNGHLHVLQWARAHDPPCPWDEKTCAWAAQYGHVHVLQWARAQNPPCSEF